MRRRVLASTVVVVLTGALTLGAVLAISSSGSTTQTHFDYVTLNSIGDLTRESDLVIVATLKGESGTRKVPQVDPARPDLPEERFSIRKDFEIEVESYLKGSGRDSIMISVVVGQETS